MGERASGRSRDRQSREDERAASAASESEAANRNAGNLTVEHYTGENTSYFRLWRRLAA